MTITSVEKLATSSIILLLFKLSLNPVQTSCFISFEGEEARMAKLVSHQPVDPGKIARKNLF